MSQNVAQLHGERPTRWGTLLLWLAIVAAVGLAGSWVTLPKIPTWYAALGKPWFTPPNAVFGPIWTTLYVVMAFAAWRVSGSGKPGRARAIALFAVQLAFNAIWSPVFFGLEAPRAGLAVIVALLMSLAVTVVMFLRIDRLAGLLLIPYLCWVAYATALNTAIVFLN